MVGQRHLKAGHIVMLRDLFAHNLWVMGSLSAKTHHTRASHIAGALSLILLPLRW